MAYIHFSSGLGICSFAHRSLAHLLRSLRLNERLWAIQSDHSGQMSDYDRIAQGAHYKWATVSDSLRSLMIHEQIAHFFERIASLVFRSQKTSDSLKTIWLKSYFFVCFLKFFNERCEQIAQVTHPKWEMWVNCSGPSQKWANDQMSESLVFKSESLIIHKNEQFAQKTNEWISNMV